jgi:hypothetical protein
VERATGIRGKRIYAGLRDLEELANTADSPIAGKRLRRPGGGRPPITETYPDILTNLEALVDPVARGDQGSPLRWTCKSVNKLAEELQANGFKISPSKVGHLLHDLGYRLQGNDKTREGSDHPDRNAQFEYINAQAKDFVAAGQPVISVDTKKKELVGDGTSHDTEFAAASVLQWWKTMGRKAYPEAKELLITADSGGGNAARSRLWKVAMQAFADRTGLMVTVCHFPAGTSKWNRIEHGLSAHVSQNWRGRPFQTLDMSVQLVAAATPRSRLRMRARVDHSRHETGVVAPDPELHELQIATHGFHGDWNYSAIPRV